MKEIDLEDVKTMERSFRCTVMNPLYAKLEQYDRIKKEIHVWEKLAAQSKMLRAPSLKLHSRRLEDHEKRVLAERDVYRVAALLQEVGTTLLLRLGKSLFCVIWWLGFCKNSWSQINVIVCVRL